MVTSRRVNGIYLTKSGEARYNSEEKRKLNLMVTANQVMRRVTKRNMSKPEKLWRCYLKAVSYGYGGTGNDYDFRYYYSNWDEIGRASVGKECKSVCRSRWSPDH